MTPNHPPSQAAACVEHPWLEPYADDPQQLAGACASAGLVASDYLASLAWARTLPGTGTAPERAARYLRALSLGHSHEAIVASLLDSSPVPASETSGERARRYRQWWQTRRRHRPASASPGRMLQARRAARRARAIRHASQRARRRTARTAPSSSPDDGPAPAGPQGHSASLATEARR